MNRLITGSRFPAVTHAFVTGVVSMLVLVSNVGTVHAQPGGAQLTPEQRRDAWQRMTPEQREQWRNARPPGERQRSAPPSQPGSGQDLRGQVTPDERQAMRQRFFEQQQGRTPNMPGNPPSRRQLSPEERQQLRQQIEQARDQYRRGNGANGGNRGPNK